jgi:hypothetical protein
MQKLLFLIALAFLSQAVTLSDNHELTKNDFAEHLLSQNHELAPTGLFDTFNNKTTLGNSLDGLLLPNVYYKILPLDYTGKNMVVDSNSAGNVYQSLSSSSLSQQWRL